MDDFELYFDEEDYDEGMAECECCGNLVYVGNAACFICPECGTQQNI